MVIPSIETERLVLRGHHVEDLAACARMWADAGVTRHIGGRPFNEEEVWARLLRYVGHWALLGYGYWVIEEKATGVYLGELGFADFKRAIEPGFAGAPEMGWALVPAVHGRGLATEAVSAALAWGDTRFPGRIVCMIDPANVASLRVAAKVGFREYTRTFYKGELTVLFERTR